MRVSRPVECAKIRANPSRLNWRWPCHDKFRPRSKPDAVFTACQPGAASATSQRIQLHFRDAGDNPRMNRIWRSLRIEIYDQGERAYARGSRGYTATSAGNFRRRCGLQSYEGVRSRHHADDSERQRLLLVAHAIAMIEDEIQLRGAGTFGGGGSCHMAIKDGPLRKPAFRIQPLVNDLHCDRPAGLHMPRVEQARDFGFDGRAKRTIRSILRLAYIFTFIVCRRS